MTRKNADRLLIAIFVCVAAPWILSVALAWKANRAMDGIGTVISDSVDDMQIDNQVMRANLREGGIATKPDLKQIKARYKHLRSYLALPDQIVRENSFVNLVMLDLHKRDGWKVPVSVDVSGLGRSAIVLASNGSMLVKVSGAKPGQRGKLGVESPLPGDIAGLEHGLLAGLKVARKSVPVIRTIYGDKSEVASTCLRAIDWMRHFDVKPEDFVLWHLAHARAEVKIEHSGGDLRLASKRGKLIKLGSLKRACREHQALFSRY